MYTIHTTQFPYYKVYFKHEYGVVHFDPIHDFHTIKSILNSVILLECTSYVVISIL